LRSSEAIRAGAGVPVVTFAAVGAKPPHPALLDLHVAAVPPAEAGGGLLVEWFCLHLVRLHARQIVGIVHRQHLPVAWWAAAVERVCVLDGHAEPAASAVDT
jgi:hypothetical protein